MNVTDVINVTKASLEPAAAERAGNTLNWIIGTLNLKNDAALSRALEVAPPVISKIRHGRVQFGPSLIIRTHEITDAPVRTIKEMLGEECLKRYAPA